MLDATLLEENLEELYEHAPCGYVSTLPNGTFARANQTFLSWLGYEASDLIGKRRFQDLLLVGGKIYYETHFAPLLRMQGAVHEVAFDLVCHDQRVLPVFVNTVQKRDEAGVPLLNRITIFDATDRRRYERELQTARARAEQALRLRDNFVALAAHELRTPLTSIVGNIQLLQRRINRANTMEARDQRTLQVIANQTNRLNKMIYALLDVTRLETGQLAIEREPVDVSVLVSRIVDELQETAGQRPITLTCLPDASPVLGDELRLEQVFQNLLQNALKYSEPATPISVTVDQTDTVVRVAVTDRGIGIPAEGLPRLFDRFYRATNVETQSYSGLGIGLYVVKEIVALHGGQIDVDSIEGQGSTFAVTLPLIGH